MEYKFKFSDEAVEKYGLVVRVEDYFYDSNEEKCVVTDWTLELTGEIYWFKKFRSQYANIPCKMKDNITGSEFDGIVEVFIHYLPKHQDDFLRLMVEKSTQIDYKFEKFPIDD